jgi:hypothetical protein
MLPFCRFEPKGKYNRQHANALRRFEFIKLSHTLKITWRFKSSILKLPYFKVYLGRIQSKISLSVKAQN